LETHKTNTGGGVGARVVGRERQQRRKLSWRSSISRACHMRKKSITSMREGKRTTGRGASIQLSQGRGAREELPPAVVDKDMGSYPQFEGKKRATPAENRSKPGMNNGN